ncbi:MAG: hypothetical protein A2Y33_06940 [Spirochaetes bacterium GWF1_51_8]|nr:MAG: hypothetical protein A2Y33_06940 [Spirochaetes bacterium GWF1_51_8]
MGSRFLLALAGFVLICGAGGLWLGMKLLQKKRIIKSLLSLPKERRFFWYKLRQSGFEIYSQAVSRDEKFFVDDNEKHCGLRADFLARRDGRKYVCLSAGSLDEKELLKIYFTYRYFFKTDGVVFYDQNARALVKWD